MSIISKNDNEKKKISERTKRTFRFGVNAVVLTVAFIVIAVLFTVLVEKLPLTLDLTTEGLYSVTDNTKNYLDRLESDPEALPIEITVLLDRVKAESNAYSTEYDISNVVKVLDIYDRYNKITVNYVDPNKNPSIVTDILKSVDDGSGSIKTSTLVSDCGEGDSIVKCGNKVKLIELSDMFATKTDSTYGLSYISGVQIETMVTGAILHVTQESAPHIYFSTGFGEKSLSDYSVLIYDLEFMGFAVDKVDLTKTGIPEDAAILIFIGPKTDLSATITDELEDWFSNSTGNAVFLMDTDITGTELTNFNYIFNLFGLKINNDVVKESGEKSIAGNTLAFKSTTITAGALSQVPNTEVTVENTRSIEMLTNTIARSTANALIQTSKYATTSSIPSGNEKTGQVTVAASGEYYGGTTEAKIILTGSSENAKDKYDYGNTMSRLLLKSINWMYESTLSNEATSIDAKVYNTTTVSVTNNQSNVIAVICIVVYPAIILICGLVIWLRRRHL